MEKPTTNHDVQPIRMPVRHDLTNEEIAGEARKLAALTRVRERKESEFKCLQKQWKSDDQQLELQINAHRDRIEQGWDMRPADCVVYFNEPEKGKKTIILASNGSVVSVEDMSPFDLDKELPLQMPAETLKDANVLPDDTSFLGDGDIGGANDINNINFSSGRLATRVGDILDSTAAKTEQPLVLIPDFGSPDWGAKTLRSEFKKAAKKAGWPEVAIDTLLEQCKGNNLPAIRDTLRPHVKHQCVHREVVEGIEVSVLKVDTRASELSHDELVSAFGTFDGKQFASVFGLLDPLVIELNLDAMSYTSEEKSNVARKLNDAAIVANWTDQARRQLDHAMDGATLDQLVALAERLSGKGVQS